MDGEGLEGKHEWVTRAVMVGSRVDTKDLERWPSLRIGIVERARGRVLVFSTGVLVFVGVDRDSEEEVLEEMAPRVRGRLADRETEEVTVRLDPSADRPVDPSGQVLVPEISDEWFAAVASVLAKSVVLAHYEKEAAEAVERVERLAERLRDRRGPGARPSELLRELGDVLLAQSRMIGRAEVGEKLGLTWDLPQLDRFYERLALEYELADRDHALSRKLGLVAETARIHLELLGTTRSLRVEWYIVVLIVAEIVLQVVDMLAR